MELKQNMLDVIAQRDIQQGEDYLRKMNKAAFISCLMEKGHEKEAIEEALIQLCDEGCFVADEQNVYEYELH